MRMERKHGGWSAGWTGAVLTLAGGLLGCGANVDEPLLLTARASAMTEACQSTDRALNAPVTSSGYWSTNAPELAVDGSSKTLWHSNTSTGAWLRVDLQQVRPIRYVVLTWGWDPNAGASAESVIEGSLDGTTWTKLATTTRNSVGCNSSTGGSSCYTPEILSFAPTSARYVRFRATRWNGGWGHVSQFSVPVSNDLAQGAPATSSGYWSTYAPELAVDGNGDTVWHSNASTGAWLQVDLRQARPLDHAMITWGWDPNAGASADSVLEGSTDGTTWTTLTTTTRASVGCNSSTGGSSCYTPEELAFAPTSARYVRFRATRWNGGWGHVGNLMLYACGAP
jgi:hypothetical protein